jgi:hypothetical protein
MASINDKLTPTFNTANPNVARVTATRAGGATTLTCDNLAGWPVSGTGAVHFSTYRIDTNNAIVANTQIDWKGLVTSSTTIGSLTRQAGATDTGNAIGDVVEANPTASWAQDLFNWGKQEHNQLDGTHSAITATSVAATGAVSGATGSFSTSVTEAGNTLQTYRSDVLFDHVASGLVWTGLGLGTTLTATMTSGVVYINGQRLAISSVASRAFTASKDTYIDILNTAGVGSIVYTEVANNAASPALAANSIRIGIIVTGATIAAAASINQGQEDRVLPIASSVPYAVTDSLGNLICPRDPNRKLLGYKQITSTASNGTPIGAVAGLSCPVIVPTGRKIKVSIHASGLYNSTGAQRAEMTAWDGTVGSGTKICEFWGYAAATNAAEGGMAEGITTPTTASKTYNVGLLANASGTASIDCASNRPAFIKVELA